MSTYHCDCAGKLSDAHRHGCAIFKCGTCGEQAYVAPPGDGPTYCTKCCPDHEYEYERGVGRRCVTCFAEPPADWYQQDFDR